MRPGGEGGHAGAVRVTESQAQFGVLRLSRASVRFRAVSGDTSIRDRSTRWRTPPERDILPTSLCSSSLSDL